MVDQGGWAHGSLPWLAEACPHHNHSCQHVSPSASILAGMVHMYRAA